MPKKRIDQVNQLVKEEVSKLILREIELSKDAIITVTRTETSSDLRHATVYISTLFKDKQEAALHELNRSIYDIQIDKAYEIEQKLYETLAEEEDGANK